MDAPSESKPLGPALPPERNAIRRISSPSMGANIEERTYCFGPLRHSSVFNGSADGCLFFSSFIICKKSPTLIQLKLADILLGSGSQFG